MKDSIIQLKERLETNIYIKLENKTKLLKESITQNENLNKEIKSLNEEKDKLKMVEEEFKVFREKFNSLIKEKSKMDNFTAKQELIIKNLEEDVERLNKEVKEKDIKYKKLDDIYLSVIKIIEDHKKIIQNLKNKIKVKENEEKNKKMIIYQKDQEIILLRNFINSYKNDIKNKYRSGGGDKNISLNTIKNKIDNSNYYNKQREFPNLHKNKSSIDITKNSFNQKLNYNRNNLPKVELKNGNYNKNAKLSESSYLKKNYLFGMDDKEEENIKEITNLMKKMINE
jgi:hypothetical protein